MLQQDFFPAGEDLPLFTMKGTNSSGELEIEEYPWDTGAMNDNQVKPVEPIYTDKAPGLPDEETSILTVEYYDDGVLTSIHKMRIETWAANAYMTFSALGQNARWSDNNRLLEVWYDWGQYRRHTLQ